MLVSPLSLAVGLVLASACGVGQAAAAGVGRGSPQVQAGVSTSDQTCLAKVVMHEAGNQPRLGQVAVARVVLNRLASGRFGRTICGVVNQPGQFFETARYRPSTASLQWRVATAVAAEALLAENRAVVAGALFFNGSHAKVSWRSRRVLLAEIGDHSFYR